MRCKHCSVASTPSRRINVILAGLAVRRQKNGPRFRRGPSCLGSLALRELGWRPYGGVAVGLRSRASGEDDRDITAAPSRLQQERFGGTLLPGPPNCFPSTSHARCWSSRAPAFDPDCRSTPSGRCRGPQSACGRRESGVLIRGSAQPIQPGAASSDADAARTRRVRFHLQDVAIATGQVGRQLIQLGARIGREDRAPTVELDLQVIDLLVLVEAVDRVGSPGRHDLKSAARCCWHSVPGRWPNSRSGWPYPPNSAPSGFRLAPAHPHP